MFYAGLRSFCLGRHGRLRRLTSALDAAGVLLQQISNITGTPGVSVGVLHHGDVVHTANYGFRDIEQKITPNEDTSWLICSLTKAFTASMVGMLIDEGKLDFTTQLRDVFPEYRRSDAQANITIEDLLSHRTGLAPYDGLWYASDNQIPFPRSQAIPLLNYVPAAGPLRAKFLYNNIAFEVLGQVIEKVTGLTYRQVFHQRIVEPLKLNRTFYAEDPFDNNTAKSYAVLANRSYYEIPPWGHGEDLFIGAAGAIRSSVNDLLVVYKAIMDAANADVAVETEIGSHNPFKQQKELLEGKIGVGSKTLREYTYASGWIRAQLPNVVGLFADFVPPVLGKGAASRLMIHHQGYIAGNVAYVAIFPETTTAVVVLANSAGLTDTMRLLGQVVVEAVFENKINEAEYLKVAQTAGENYIKFVHDVHKELMAGKTTSTPTRALSAYAGRYYNSIGNYFIEIKQLGDKLQVAYGGEDFDTFDLEPYQTDSFFWWLDYDESAKRARLPGYPKEYFILEFGCPATPSWWDFGAEPKMECLTWKHEFSMPGNGEKLALLPSMASPIDWQQYSIASLYDSIGARYETAYADIPAQQASLEWLLAQLPDNGCTILDIGCGTGHPVATALAAPPGCHHVHGIDISGAMISAARQAVPSATFEQIDFRHFTAERGTYDAVTSYFALLVAMSQEQIRDTMRSIHGWLKPGGLLVFSTIPADVEHFEQTWLGRKAVFSSLSEEQITTLLTELGMRVEYSRVHNFKPKAAEAGLCGVQEVAEEPQLFVYARKPA
ncbi:hypothetical protein AK830_g12275 [Neonectria ditissima]|uniref:Beta-lactamase-related domain-containing protein n=1 Tax=Neonectria ditissima TaxID=78410 RepID=A0A0P7B5U0_9HYPO|nr:hypothetical protein AK830_g12275 [Neonectria ditissima]